MGQKVILIVDDSAVIRRTLMLTLKNHGYNVLETGDPSSALTCARNTKPDLMLLDISFPPDVAHGGGVAWDGLLVMSWMQRMDELSGLPVIIITGGDPATLKPRAMAAGAAGFFQKPIDNEALLAKVKELLGEPAPASPPASG